ncbi:MAG TPA: PEGA domain-containing protein, partial [Polyangiaceae bacterium]|nr:PEGA domain-containing protein [Polyangiaceae bacterium]
DDEEIGTTPIAGPTPVDMGKHKITLRKRGFREITKEVRVVGPTPEQHLSFRLERDIPASTLEVTAGHGQTITLDDTVVGYNRWEGLVSPTKHRVRVSGAGYKPKEIQVDLSDGRRASVWVVAQPLEPSDRTNRWPLVVLLGSVTAVVGVVAYYGLRAEPRAQSSTQGGLMTIDGFGKD